ncbi:hypothetical protein CHUAL_013011 [Chamberlinius hualienensis]
MYVIFPAQDVVDWGYSIPTIITTVSNSCLNNNNNLGQSVKIVIEKMSNQEYSLKQLSHPAFNEAIKLHNGVTFKLVKTVADFAQQLATIHERHAEELQSLVETFRKRNADLRRERPSYPSTLFNSWETFLQEVEVDSQIHSDIASILGRHVSVPILERTFHRKVQSRKIFIHRESCETILSKTEELLFKCCKEYDESYERLLMDRSPSAMEAYIDAHNAYVQQLHATNAIIDEYNNSTLPHLLEEMEEVYIDLSDTIARSILEGAEIIGSKAQEQNTRYDVLVNFCKAVNSKADLEHYIKSINVEIRVPANGQKHDFKPPQYEIPDQNEMMMSPPPPIPFLKNEVVVDKGLIVPMKSKYDALKKEANELEAKLRGLHETLEALVRLQQRSLDSSLFNKANEIQEDISLKRFDLRVSQIHLAAVKAQIDLLVTALENKGDNLLGSHERKMSSASAGSIKSKWLKAFKSLKSGGSGPSGSNGDRRSGGASGGGDRGQVSASGAAAGSAKNGGSGSTRVLEVTHIFQEYTYKKITACDVCHEILKGHTRQGLRCKMCKMNIHSGDCQEKVGKCQPKPRLLRRQKSTSEIETRPSEKEDDTVSVRSSADTASVFNLRNPFGSMKNRMMRTPPPSSPSAEGVLNRRKK